MSVGTVSVDGVQVAEVESFSFVPADNPPADWSVPSVLPGLYHSVALSFTVPEPTYIRQVPKGHWSHKINRGIAYVVRGFVVGIVDGPFGMCETSAGRTMSMKQGRRRCESKRWVERTYAEAWYREEMWRRMAVAMGFRVVTDTEVGGQNG